MSVLDEYNQLLDRQRKGAQYLDNPKIPLAEREKWKGEYAKILKRLSELYTILKKQGVPESEVHPNLHRNQKRNNQHG